MLYLAAVDIMKNGQGNAANGDKFTYSLRYVLPTDCRSSITPGQFKGKMNALKNGGALAMHGV